jgi:hypothetical protein
MPYKSATSPGTNKPPISTDYNPQEQKKIISNKSDFRLALYMLRLRVPDLIVLSVVVLGVSVVT